MKILFVAMSDSIHTASWINQIADKEWQIRLLSSTRCNTIHPEIHNITVYHDFHGRIKLRESSDKYRRYHFRSKMVRDITKGFFKKYYKKHGVKRLLKIIKSFKPDIIHSLEFQSAGYLVAEAKRLSTQKFPIWIATNWGSDMYLFGRLKEHEVKIRDLLKLCDYYSCECDRDVKLAIQYGVTAKILPVMPNTGGFNLEIVSRLRQMGPTSSRRLIMLKGYQNWSGRALVGLRALELSAHLLKGYSVAIYSASLEVVIASELFAKATGIPVTIVPKNTHRQNILSLHGQARISISLSISDGISTSLLESMVMGSFPIQSWTACANEWISDGKNGILCPPEDPDVIAQDIQRALIQDDLVDQAAEMNYRIAKERLDQTFLKKKVINIYESVWRETGILE